ncbi:MAG: M4 family metallopeptidase [Thiolinea sp.]
MLVKAPQLTRLSNVLLVASIIAACTTSVCADTQTELNTLLSQDPNLQITWNKAQTKPTYLSGTLSLNQQRSSQQLVEAFLQKNPSLIGLPPASKLKLAQSKQTPAGTVLSYQQTHHGLEVIGAKLVARVAQGRLTTLANHLVNNLDISAKPSIEPAAAIYLAAQDLGDTKLAAEKNDLVYLTWEGSQHLAWRILFPKQLQPLAQYQVWVDAHSGEIILTENRVESYARPSIKSTPNTQAKAFKSTSLPPFFSLSVATNELSELERAGAAVGKGKGLDGKLKKFQTYQKPNGNYLLHSRQGSNPTVSYYTYNYLSGETMLFQDADNVWDDPSAVDAYTKAVITFGFYRSLGPINAWYPDSGFVQGINSIVHVRDFEWDIDNAFWTGNAMFYGDGDVYFYPLAGSLDVVAHELTHGMTEATTNLIYCNEPGALNESWSDVMSMLLSLKRGDPEPYLLADNIMKIKTTLKGRYALRRIDDPTFRSDQYPGNDFSLAALKEGKDVWGQPASMSEKYIERRCTPANDVGGVHINSGIVNRAAYLISKALGPQATSAIYYQALFYLTSVSDFKDAREALKQAATDLYGANSEAVKQIELAFTTVGIN